MRGNGKPINCTRRTKDWKSKSDKGRYRGVVLVPIPPAGVKGATSGTVVSPGGAGGSCVVQGAGTENIAAGESRMDGEGLESTCRVGAPMALRATEDTMTI